MINEDDPADRPTLVAADGAGADPLSFTICDGDSVGEPVVFLRNAAGAIAAVNILGAPLWRLAYVER